MMRWRGETVGESNNKEEEEEVAEKCVKEKEVDEVKTGEACSRDLGQGFSQTRVHKDTQRHANASCSDVNQTNQPFPGMSICTYGFRAL